ncbi:PTS system glucitol/sorbitol-specific IIC component [Tamaricihabitans halophyticus]|uniref:PTS system glucitol/sorbitol-specific IIC component n=1 Tax=Tamaricihabitans halophyticus TaxID=1262583 RepID=A0A4R2QVF2_9PSEU|nr:PTS glucitol/sorbitol transporter subunit IIB [Tamaricihabitans halophyticus]TCP54023.1 PTS system glucitol/sorbitol-specific IIC component [Tamaricihabitans halophyticus]
MTSRDTRAVFVRPGSGGWGRGLHIEPSEQRRKVLSVTGGGIHPVAERIAELTGCEAVDGFKTSVPDEEVLCAVINCGGTARIGVYPRKRIPTVDVFAGGPGGPLAKFITEDIFVSAVGVAEIEPAEAGEISEGTEAPVAASAGAATGTAEAEGGSASGGGGGTATATATAPAEPENTGWFHRISGVFVSFGTAVGSFVNTFLSAGRQTVELTLHTILPFMAYVSLLLGFVHYTGVAEAIGRVLSPIATNPFGLVAIGLVTALPFLSPILGPGAAIAQVIGTLMGSQIAIGALPVQYALPTLFAINGQVGCDFVPVGLALGEAKPETVSVGTPAVLISRMITSPLAVIIAWAASFGL